MCRVKQDVYGQETRAQSVVLVFATSEPYSGRRMRANPAAHEVIEGLHDRDDTPSSALCAETSTRNRVDTRSSFSVLVDFLSDS